MPQEVYKNGLQNFNKDFFQLYSKILFILQVTYKNQMKSQWNGYFYL